MLGSLYLSVDSTPLQWFNRLETHRYGVAYDEIQILGQRKNSIDQFLNYRLFNKNDTALSKMSIFKTLRMTASTEIKQSKLAKTFKKSSPMSQV